MATNIFRPIKFGKEVFYPKSYDENSFVMDWTMEAGGMVPPHKHEFMDEQFTVTKGEVLFTVNGKKVTKKVGEVLLVPKGTPHSIKNPVKGQIGLTVKYSPCSDTHRLFEMIATFDETNPGKVMNMLKAFYVGSRIGLKPFSTPHPAVASSIINFIVTVTGKVSGWDKLVTKFK